MTSDSGTPDIKLSSASNDVEKTKIEPIADIDKKEKSVVGEKSEKDKTSDEVVSESPVSESIDIFGDLPLKTSPKDIQVQFKSDKDKLLLILPTEAQISASEETWSDICQQIKLRINANQRLLSSNTNLHLMSSDRLLDGRQLQQLEQMLNSAKINLVSVSTSRRQTAIAAVSAGYSVEQLKAPSLFNSPSETANNNINALYLETTVRSGVDIRHSGSITILGDVNPGGSVIADGDILVWGRLRGLAHAGVNGNSQCIIMALQMEPTQLRIADAVARAPEKSLTQSYPEVAYVTSEGIRISKATDFSRNTIQSPEEENLQLDEIQLLSQQMRKKDIDK